MMSGLMGSMASGMAMGTGMAVANRAVDAVMGPRQTEVVHRHEGAPAAPAAAPAGGLCQVQQDQLTQCMQSSRDASAVVASKPFRRARVGGPYPSGSICAALLRGIPGFVFNGCIGVVGVNHSLGWPRWF